MISRVISTLTPPVGIIQSLGQGFDIVSRKPYLLLIPLLVDLFLWAGPRINYTPAIASNIAQIQATAAETGDETLIQSWDQLAAVSQEMIDEIGDQYLPVAFLPTLLADEIAHDLPFNHTPSVWMVARPVGVLGARLEGALAGLAALGLYMLLIGEVIRQSGKFNVLDVLRRMPAFLLQFAGLALLLPVVVLIVLVPFGLLALVAALLVPWLGLVVMLGALLLLSWMSLYGVFVLHGMLINRRNLFLAIWDSVRIVQWNLGPTVTMVLGALLLYSLTNLVWLLADTSTWMALFGMIGHAFVATGLVTATFVFFKDYHRYWREMRELLLAELDRKQSIANQANTP
ncbi:MAG: hypothetical protein IT326_09040 [Anaerolineae bacterium]|nr:hypothetical protein [Anaerolineae bacterium]